MAEIILEARVKPAYSANTEYHDKVLEAGAILIDNASYDDAHDREYDVKGLSGVYLEIKNTGGANGVTWLIEKARKEFTDITTLVDADYEVENAEANIAFGAQGSYSFVRADPEITAIRVRLKEQVGGNSTTIEGVTSA